MRKFISNKTYHFIGMILLFVLWYLLAIIIGKQDSIFPGPLETFKVAFSMLKTSYVYRCIIQSITRMLIGFIISFIFALLFGIIAGNNKAIKEILKPFITSLKAIPTACLVYLFIVLSGSRIAPMYIVMLISFPILYESISGGIENVDSSITNALLVDGASYLKRNFRVYLPLALPYIAVGLASSFSLSFKIEIMAEVITGYTRLGLGSAILAAQRSDPTNMVPVFAYGLIAVILMLIIDMLSEKVKKSLLKYFN